MTDKAPTVPVTPNNELLLNLGLTKEGDNDTAITAAALYDDEKKKFDAAAAAANDASAISLREPMNKILGEPGNAAQLIKDAIYAWSQDQNNVSIGVDIIYDKRR